jgi:hypothetical protein
MKRLLLFIIPVIVLSCKKDPKPAVKTETDPGGVTNTAKSDVVVRVTNVADNTVLVLSPEGPFTPSTTVYVNANQDSFTVSKFKYYISHVSLKKADGNFYIPQTSYHLLNAEDSLNKGSFTIKDVPADNYIAINFMIGVDSEMVMSGVQTGDLDPVNDMYWDWNQGYIFFKFEGYSTKVAAQSMHNVTYHVGGYAAPYNMIRSVSLPFPTALTVDGDHASTIFMKANVQDCFRKNDTIPLGEYYFATAGNTSKRIVGNYVNMFKVAAVKH